MHKVGQVASHNSYEISDWTSLLSDVNSIELDVWPRENWMVRHVDVAGGGHLVGYMEGLAEWRKANTHRDLLVVYVEIKSSTGWRVGDFESIFLNQFSTSELFRPIDLANWGTSKGNTVFSLKELVKTYGWPDFGDYKNKIMFVVNGDDVIDSYMAERPVMTTDGQGNTIWSTQTDVAPTFFVMSGVNEIKDNILLKNGELTEFADLSSAPNDNLLRRAYRVNQGNDEMNAGHPTIAENLMKKKWINYLCYDNVEGAFWTSLA